ncbi:MAG: sigma-70 family RNA polymerase sigma factor [Burkholderiales bacterium]|nr:MAG: sigma-70 family RNA polymerase sigma factor [Burkholderiales bacterium]
MDTAQLVAMIPRLRRYARMLIGNAALADDLVQDTLERAYARRAQWRAGTDLRAWCFTIMHNLFVNQAQRVARRGERPIDDMDPSTTDTVLGASDPTEGWGQALDLQDALLALSQDHRRVLLLVTVEQLSYEEVAEVLAVPVGTVMSRLARARARLRALMSEGDPVGRQTRLRALK